MVRPRLSDAAARIAARKKEHLDVTLAGPASGGASAGWEEVALRHRALPEVDRDAIDLGIDFLGRRLRYPILISGMTGGHPEAEALNATLARAAERHGIAIGVGSQRAHLAAPALATSYRVVRDEAPTAIVVANIGAPNLIVQADRGAMTAGELQHAIDLLHADALAIHLNFLQEAVQPEGETRARGVLAAFARLAGELRVPLIAKETGAGIGRATGRQLVAAGARVIDVGGAGGTSFAAVEAERARRQGDGALARLGDAFADWGIPTAVCVAECRPLSVPVIASGGIRSGLDAAKAVALGATLVGIARPLLVAARDGDAAVDAYLHGFLQELRTAMFLTGAGNLAALRRVRPVVTGRVRAWLDR